MLKLVVSLAVLLFVVNANTENLKVEEMSTSSVNVEQGGEGTLEEVDESFKIETI